MKLLSLALSLFAMTFALAFQTQAANCKNKLNQRLFKALENEGHAYYGLSEMSKVEVQRIARGSEELSQKQQEAIAKLLSSESYEMYLLDASAGPASYQDLFFISKKTCNTVRRFTVYVE